MLPPALKRSVKRLLRPLLTPLLFRLNRPFAELQPQVAHLREAILNAQSEIESLRADDSRNRHQRSVDDLARVWLRTSNEIKQLRTDVDGRFEELRGSVLRDTDRSIAQLKERLAVLAGHVDESVLSRIQGFERTQEEKSLRVDITLRQLTDRIEFVRRELMFEYRYGSNAAGTGERTGVASKVINAKKIEQAMAQGSLRINLGCGHIPLPEYINVDLRDVPGVDVVADVGKLPFEPSTVGEVFSAHLMEHFPQEELRRRLLPHWHSLLRPGGRLRAIVPDGDAMLRGIAEGEYPFEDFREVLFGSQDYDGDFHFNLLTPDSLTQLVKEAGFSNVEVPVRGRRNGQCFEFELVATR